MLTKMGWPKHNTPEEVMNACVLDTDDNNLPLDPCEDCGRMKVWVKAANPDEPEEVCPSCQLAQVVILGGLLNADPPVAEDRSLTVGDKIRLFSPKTKRLAARVSMLTFFFYMGLVTAMSFLICRTMSGPQSWWKDAAFVTELMWTIIFFGLGVCELAVALTINGWRCGRKGEG